MKLIKLYKPKMNLKEVVIELATILQVTNPCYEARIQELIEEMNNWGEPIKPKK